MVKSFRVWDNQFGLFVKKGLYLSMDGSIGEVGHVSKEFIPAEKDRYTVCFNSGLVDDFGQDLYEGDIIRVREFDLDNGKLCSTNNYVVLFNTRFGIWSFYTKNTLSKADECDGSKLLIINSHVYGALIGNMFENADCL